MGFGEFVVGFTHTNLCVIFSHKLAQILHELFFVEELWGMMVGRLGGIGKKLVPLYAQICDYCLTH